MDWIKRYKIGREITRFCKAVEEIVAEENPSGGIDFDDVAM